MPQLRYATLQDAAAISEIATSTFYSTYAAYNTPEDMDLYIQQHFSTAHIQTELAAKNTGILLAMEYDEIIGYTKVVWGSRPGDTTNMKALEIARLYAATNYIGKGVGKLLMQYCLQYAKDGGAQSIWLGVWQRNTRAIRFYEKCGFRLAGIYTFLLGKDEQQDYIMERAL